MLFTFLAKARLRSLFLPWSCPWSKISRLNSIVSNRLRSEDFRLPAVDLDHDHDGDKDRDLLVSGLKLQMRSDRGAVGLLLLAIYLPLVLISMFAAIEISLWYRANAALELAAGEVARVANAAVLASGNNPTPTEKSLLTWQSNGATLDNSLKGALQRCLATGQTSDSATIENLKECYATWQALKASPTDINLGFVPAGIKNSASFSNPLFAPHFTELPFALWDPHPTTPSFSQVQYLPTICIRNGCHEPYNESASSTVGECSYRRPICWSVHDGSLDFDGDGNNDLVFFRPTGSGPNIDSNTIKDADFIVYPSANGYALSGSDSFFDLSEERAPSAPADLPVVGDYDGDGKADPAVFNPQTATVTVLPSRGQYAIRVIFDVSAAVDPDPLGQEATIAIPGHYLSNAFEIAFVKTASASPQTRYDIGIAAFTHGFDGLEDLVTQGIKTISGSTAVNKLSAMKFKPPLGNIAIPAFADYNQDGRTELGYLSYPGGNRTKWIAGSPKQKGIYYTPYTTASHPLAVKINPFDLKLDSKGVLYFVDAIAARIFRIMPGENGGFDGLKQDALLLSDVDDSSESLQLVVNAVSSNPLKIINQILPRFSVWNIPKPLFPLLGADPGTAAADRLLVEPRRIAIGPDDVLYVADKAGRILRFEPSGTSVSSSSLGSEVLGSFYMYEKPSELPAIVSNTNTKRCDLFRLRILRRPI
jgi:hypothetical protein